MQIHRKELVKAVFFHLTFWIVFILYESASLAAESGSPSLFMFDGNMVTAIPTVILICYINLYILLPYLYYIEKTTLYIILLAVLIVSGGLLERYFFYAVWNPRDRLNDPSRFFGETKDFWVLLRIVRNTIRILPPVLFTAFMKMMRKLYKNEKYLRELEKEKYSAELGFLKAQVNPHFFFNTLNSLYALTIDKAEQASKIVLRLSELMHYMLYKTSAASVLLRDEISYLENYISIEQMRFYDRLEVSFQASGDIDGKMIAPLILLPFVENAFKHCNIEVEGWITINLKFIDNLLILKVKNSYQVEKQTNPYGLGITNVKRRLALIYPGKYELHLRPCTDFFEADLRIEI